MKKIISLFIILGCLFSFMSIANATTNLEIYGSINSKGVVTITGNVKAENKNVGLIILYPSENKYKITDITEENFNTIVAVSDQLVSTQLGDISGSYTLPSNAPPGYYQVFIGCDGSSNSMTFYYSTDEEKEQLVNLINGEKNVANYQALIKRYIYDIPVINAPNDLTFNSNKDEIIEMMFNSLNDKTVLSIEEINTQLKLETATYAINKSTTDSISQTMLSYKDIINWEADSDYLKYRSSIQKAVICFRDASNNKKFASFSHLENSKREIYAIGVVNGATNSEITNILSRYNDIYKVDLTGKYILINKVEFNKALFNKNFTTVKDIVDAFNNKLKIMKDNQSSGGGTGGGTGGGGTTSGSQNIEIEKSKEEENTKLPSIFSDIEDVSWAKDAITELAVLGIINGNSDGKFLPNNAITREEYIKLLVTAFSLIDETATCDFDDVKEGDWFYTYIASAKKLGLTNGISDNMFGISQKITRQEMATLAYRFAKYVNIDLDGLTGKTFDDYEEIDDYAKEAVEKMSAKNIINGFDNNTFMPLQSSTRAESVIIIYNLLKNR